MSNRNKIKAACLDLFIENGVESTSTKMILTASGVSNGGLFHHFPSKDEIVKEIYFDIKEDMRLYLEESLNIEAATRPFIEDYWTKMVKWALENDKKKQFLEMYGKSATIRKCTDDVTGDKFLFITNRIEKAIFDREIVSYNLIHFLYHFTASTDAVISYFKACPNHHTKDILEKEFIQYWRSIVNF